MAETKIAVGGTCGAGGGVRTHGGLVHQVLSLTPLATREPPQTLPNNAHAIYESS